MLKQLLQGHHWYSMDVDLERMCLAVWDSNIDRQEGVIKHAAFPRPLLKRTGGLHGTGNFALDHRALVVSQCLHLYYGRRVHLWL